MSEEKDTKKDGQRGSSRKTTAAGMRQNLPTLGNVLTNVLSLSPEDQMVILATLQAVHAAGGPTRQPSRSKDTQKPEKAVNRDELIKRLQVKKDGVTTCATGPEAREVHQLLGSERGQGSKKTIKRRLQKAKKTKLAANWKDEQDEQKNAESIKRLEDRLKSFEDGGTQRDEEDVKTSATSAATTGNSATTESEDSQEPLEPSQKTEKKAERSNSKTKKTPPPPKSSRGRSGKGRGGKKAT